MKKIVVLINNAGASEILTSLAKNETKNIRWCFIADVNSLGYKIAVRKKIKPLAGKDNPDFFESLIKMNPDFFFFGTSWNNEEYLIANKFKKAGIITIAFLDHWVNYRERFGYPKKNWKNNLPNYIAVGDNYAYKLASKFGFSNILRIKNFYLLDTLEKYKKLKIKEQPELLFISETVYRDNRSKNFIFNNKKESKILNTIFKSFSLLSKKYNIKSVNIRLHPAQQDIKIFNYYQKKFPNIKIKIEKSDTQPLIETIKKARLVIGLKSMALYVSYLIGKIAVSLLPNGGLPLPKENQFKNIKELLAGEVEMNTKPIQFYEQSLIEMLEVLNK